MEPKDFSIFPKKWSFYVSNDNSTWEAIHYNEVPLCKEENIYTVSTGEKDHCRRKDVFTYSTNHTGFHYFVKMVMKENSYFYSRNNGWQDAMFINSFELIGSYARDYLMKCLCMNKRVFSFMISAVLFINKRMCC